jgi:DNA-directed RNA polymerase specialized sigma24 family protein
VDIRKLDTEQRRDLYAAVLNAARKLASNDANAKDLTQRAFMRLDTASPWSPGGRVGLLQHMYGILKSLRSHDVEADATRREYERRAAEEHAALSDAGRSAETMILDHAERERKEALATQRVAKLRAGLAGRELDLQIIDWMMEDDFERSDLAARSGRPDEVKTALARIRRHMRAIVAAEGGEDEEVT